MGIGKDVPRHVVISTGTLPVFHALDTLPEDPENQGARLVPESGWIQVEPGLCYLADPKVWRSVERCTEGLRWRSQPGVEANTSNAPLCVDSRACTFSVGIARST